MAVGLVVEVRAAAVLGLLRNGHKRIPYAIANALNATGKRVQGRQRENVKGRMQVRKETFVMREIAVISRGDFADPRLRKFSVRIHVGQKERLLLSDFERGAQRRSFGGGRRVAVPRTGGAARPSFAQPVVTSLRFTALRLVKVRAGQVVRTGKGRSKRERRNVTLQTHTTSTGKQQIKGARRTFILTQTARAPEGGVFQRVGPGRSDIRLIYSFAANARLKAMLKWIPTARETAQQWFPRDMQAKIDDTIRFALNRALA